MVYPIDGLARPGMDIPGFRCPFCNGGRVHWNSRGTFLCFACTKEFPATDLLATGKKAKEEYRRFENLWRRTP
jgi:hypothetical protein